MKAMTRRQSAVLAGVIVSAPCRAHSLETESAAADPVWLGLHFLDSNWYLDAAFHDAGFITIDSYTINATNH